MTTEQATAKVLSNEDAGKAKYDGMTSSDIGSYNHSLMFGDGSDWDADEWSSIVD